MCFVRETSPRRSAYGRPAAIAPRRTASMWFAVDEDSNSLCMNQQNATMAAEIGYTATLNACRTQTRYSRVNTPRPLTVVLPAPVSALYRAEVFRILRRYGACASLARYAEAQKYGGQEVLFGGIIRLTAVLAPESLAPVETFHQQGAGVASDEFSFITERVNTELYALWTHFQLAAGAAPAPFVAPVPGVVGIVRPPVAVAAQTADDDLLARLTSATQTPHTTLTPRWTYVENGNVTIVEQVAAFSAPTVANEDEDDEEYTNPYADEEPDVSFEDDEEDPEDEALRLAREAIQRRSRPLAPTANPDFLANLVDTLVARRNGNG
jgi:hypothetical protein